MYTAREHFPHFHLLPSFIYVVDYLTPCQCFLADELERDFTLVGLCWGHIYIL